MGAPKALLDAAGSPFLERVVAALRTGGCDPVLVVVRSPDEPVAALAAALDARVVLNPDPGPGPISSLRAALRSLPPECRGVVLHPVDHPLVRPATVARLVDAFRESEAPIVVPVHDSKRGHPVVFHRSVFPELLEDALEEGARTVVHRHLDRVLQVPVDDGGVLADIDDARAYRHWLGGSHDPDPSAHSASAAGAAAEVLAALDAGEAAAVVLVVRGPLEDAVGRRLVVRGVSPGEGAGTSRFRVVGTLGDSALDTEAAALARRALEGGLPLEGLHTVTAEGGREVTAYVEVHQPRPELIIVGAGHIARPLCTVGTLLGFRVTVLDDRPEFAARERFPEAEGVVRVDFTDPFAGLAIHPWSHVVLVTRGHRYDYECLRRLLTSDPEPRYIGMIGSRRRVRATFVQLLEEGLPRQRIARVRAPVGLDLGAQTPEEIAVSVAAEIVLLWRGGTGRPLRDSERVLERFFPPEPGRGGDPGRASGSEADDSPPELAGPTNAEEMP